MGQRNPRAHQTSSDLSQEDVVEGIVRGVREATVGRLVPFPFGGSSRVFPAASSDNPVILDFVKGKTTIPGIGTVTNKFNTLNRLGETRANSGTIFADGGINITTLNKNEDRTGEFNINTAGTLNFANTIVAKMKITSSSPFLTGGTLSTALQMTFDPKPFANNIGRFGHQNPTQNSFTPIDFLPISGNTASDLDEPDIETAISNYGTDTLDAKGVSEVGIIIENTGGNDADVVVSGYSRSGEQEIADPDIHSNTDIDAANAITVGSNDVRYVGSGASLSTRRVQAANTNANNNTELRVQYLTQLPG